MFYSALILHPSSSIIFSFSHRRPNSLRRQHLKQSAHPFFHFSTLASSAVSYSICLPHNNLGQPAMPFSLVKGAEKLEA